MQSIEAKSKVFVLDTPYWAGEHTFAHYSELTVNDKGSFSDLWAVDTYTRSGLSPISHNERMYIWANNNAESAAEQASRFVNQDNRVLLTHIVPLDSRLNEPPHL